MNCCKLTTLTHLHDKMDTGEPKIVRRKGENR